MASARDARFGARVESGIETLGRCWRIRSPPFAWLQRVALCISAGLRAHFVPVNSQVSWQCKDEFCLPSDRSFDGEYDGATGA